MCVFGVGGEKNSRCDDSKAEGSLVTMEEPTKAANTSEAKEQARDEARAVSRARGACVLAQGMGLGSYLRPVVFKQVSNRIGFMFRG